MAVRSERRWRLLAIKLALVLTLVLAVAFVGLDHRHQPSKFCTADGRLGPDGQVYGRDAKQGCRFVDEQGKVLPDQ